MELYDSHCHFRADIAACDAELARALPAGVTRILAVGGADEANQPAAMLARRAPGVVRAALGFEYSRAGMDNVPVTVALQELLTAEHPAAVGEIGLDFHDMPSSTVTQAMQCDLFRRQLVIAAELDLPVSVHTRGADAETLAAIDSAPARSKGLRGSIHCFTGSIAFARALLDRDFCLGVSGIVTFRNGANVRELAAFCPADRLLIETDAPFLAPVPNRGRQNEPAFLLHTLAAVAAARCESPEAVAAVSFANAVALFG